MPQILLPKKKMLFEEKDLPRKYGLDESTWAQICGPKAEPSNTSSPNSWGCGVPLPRGLLIAYKVVVILTTC